MVLDDVVKTIRASKDKSDAKNNLIKQYAFSEKQQQSLIRGLIKGNLSRAAKDAEKARQAS